MLPDYGIVVLDRGFVYVGNVKSYPDFCVIEGAQNIRRWGTTRGLGELAQNGPQSATKLDPAGTVHAPIKSVMHVIATEARLWTK